MNNENFYGELKEIRRQLLDVASPLAREVTTKYVPEKRTAEDFKGIITTALIEITKLEQRIIEMEQRYLEREKDNFLEMTNRNAELEQMTKAEEDWRERANYIK